MDNSDSDETSSGSDETFEASQAWDDSSSIEDIASPRRTQVQARKALAMKSGGERAVHLQKVCALE